MLVLPNTSPGGARLLAEKLRQTVAALKIPHNTPAEGSSLTISIGLATMVPQAGSDCRLLISAADRGCIWPRTMGAIRWGRVSACTHPSALRGGAAKCLARHRLSFAVMDLRLEIACRGAILFGVFSNLPRLSLKTSGSNLGPKPAMRAAGTA